MRGNKRTFPNFHIGFLIFVNSNSFQIQNPREKMTWLLPFKMKRVFENIWIPFANKSNQTLYATRWFSWERVRWLLQNIWNRVESDEEKLWISFGSLLESFFHFEFKIISIYSNKIKREGNMTPSIIRKKMEMDYETNRRLFKIIFGTICISWFMVFWSFFECSNIIFHSRKLKERG